MEIYTYDFSKAQSLVEYGLVMMLIAMVVIIILSLLGPAIANMFSEVVVSI